MSTKGKPQARGLARRQAILDAASQLFLEKGFSGTSLSDIVERSKGSRSTLYENFGNKEGLLRAMVEEGCANLWSSVEARDDQNLLEEAALVEMGKRFVEAALDAKAIAIYRIVTTEAPRTPCVGDFFFNHGPRILQHRLSQRFRQALKAEEHDPQPERLAKIFLGSVLGDFHFRQTLGMCQTPTAQEIEDHVKTAVGVMLRGIAGYHAH